MLNPFKSTCSQQKSTCVQLFFRSLRLNHPQQEGQQRGTQHDLTSVTPRVSGDPNNLPSVLNLVP